MERRKWGKPGVSTGQGLGVSLKQEQDVETVPESQRQYVREGSEVGEGEERGLRWGRAASCQPPQKEKRGGLKAGGGVSSQQRFPPIPVNAALGPLRWPEDVPTASLWPSPSFSFIFIYLLTFMKSPCHPIPLAYVVLTIPTPPPAIQLSVQLSVYLSQGK